jgi:hypothetical protein
MTDCKTFAPFDFFSRRRIRTDKSACGFWLSMLAVAIPFIVFAILYVREADTVTSVEINQDLRRTSILISGSSYYYTGGSGNGTLAYRLWPEDFKNSLNYTTEGFEENVAAYLGPTNISVVDSLGKFDASSTNPQCLKYRFTSSLGDSYCDWLDCENTSQVAYYDTTCALSCSVPFEYDSELDCFICYTTAGDSYNCYNTSTDMYLNIAKACVNQAVEVESAKASNYYLNIYTTKRSVYNKMIGPISYGQLAFNWAMMLFSVLISSSIGNVIVHGDKTPGAWLGKTFAATSKRRSETEEKPRLPSNPDTFTTNPVQAH